MTSQQVQRGSGVIMLSWIPPPELMESWTYKSQKRAATRERKWFREHGLMHDDAGTSALQECKPPTEAVNAPPTRAPAKVAAQVARVPVAGFPVRPHAKVAATVAQQMGLPLPPGLLEPVGLRLTPHPPPTPPPPSLLQPAFVELGFMPVPVAPPTAASSLATPALCTLEGRTCTPPTEGIPAPCTLPAEGIPAPCTPPAEGIPAPLPEGIRSPRTPTALGAEPPPWRAKARVKARPRSVSLPLNQPANSIASTSSTSGSAVTMVRCLGVHVWGFNGSMFGGSWIAGARYKCV